jgi:hypothetical protein
MKTKQQIDDARKKLIDRLQTPGLNDIQKSLVGGMLNALVWVADGASQSTMERMLSDEPLAAGKDPSAGLKRLDGLAKNTCDVATTGCALRALRQAEPE